MADYIICFIKITECLDMFTFQWCDTLPGRQATAFTRRVNGHERLRRFRPTNRSSAT